MVYSYGKGYKQGSLKKKNAPHGPVCESHSSSVHRLGILHQTVPGCALTPQGQPTPTVHMGLLLNSLRVGRDMGHEAALTKADTLHCLLGVGTFLVVAAALWGLSLNPSAHCRPHPKAQQVGADKPPESGPSSMGQWCTHGWHGRAFLHFA